MSTIGWIACTFAVFLALGGLFFLLTWCFAQAMYEALTEGMDE